MVRHILYILCRKKANTRSLLSYRIERITDNFGSFPPYLVLLLQSNQLEIFRHYPPQKRNLLPRHAVLVSSQPLHNNFLRKYAMPFVHFLLGHYSLFDAASICSQFRELSTHHILWWSNVRKHLLLE